MAGQTEHCQGFHGMPLRKPAEDWDVRVTEEYIVEEGGSGRRVYRREPGCAWKPIAAALRALIPKRRLLVRGEELLFWLGMAAWCAVSLWLKPS